MYALIFYCVGVCGVWAAPRSGLVVETKIECIALQHKLKMDAAQPIFVNGKTIGAVEMAACVPVYSEPHPALWVDHGRPQ